MPNSDPVRLRVLKKTIRVGAKGKRRAMTPKDFFASIAKLSVPGTLKLQGGIRVDATDALAAKLLIWLHEQMPHASVGELEAVLDRANMWIVLFALAHNAHAPKEEP